MSKFWILIIGVIIGYLVHTLVFALHEAAEFDHMCEMSQLKSELRREIAHDLLEAWKKDHESDW